MDNKDSNKDKNRDNNEKYIKENINEAKYRVELLREQMKKENIDIYLVPTSDPHQSEYVSDHWKAREWLSGFTGSAGLLVLTLEEAGIWTDGRYFIQAEKELKGSSIKLHKMAVSGEETVDSFIKSRLKKDGILGFHGKDLSISQFNFILKGLSNFKVFMHEDIVDRIWEDRPEKPSSELFIHDEKFTGEATKNKIYRVRDHMKKYGLDYKVVSSLDEIAWLYNLRGRDTKNNPVFLSYTVISEEDAVLFTDSGITKTVEEYAQNQGFTIKKIDKFESYLESIESKTISLDPEKTSIWIKNILGKNKVIYGKEIMTYYESIRNSVQIDNLRETHRKDGASVIKLLNWIKKSLESKEQITEIDVSNKLIELRSQNEFFIEPSFDTIAAYRDHGAMMHYCANDESNYILEPDGLLLIDSGGQYLSGTTDITRTISLGNATETQKKHYTLALKGMINLSKAKFLAETRGVALDIMAREFLWNENIDYKSGTGHGVGYCLSVHLGEQRISPRAVDSILKPGMTISNEPGVYIENEYGIRIENILLVEEDKYNDSGLFYKFETLTMCPFDKELIDFDLLSDHEIKWIEKYHKWIREEMKDLLSDEEMELIW